ncbi:hypothetical protein BLS_001553 [Venturia inaequalis]|uniref:HAD-like protein n=1 Tax=Venturia inaequalis TaxID=5025 RepID=A0A8H3UU29_VENIN|nr:hypothetical protein BLS_001553 [Venturia inaequalis]
MASSKPPKVILFDIGGVCVLSPLAAIHTYESTHSIPTGYINHTISATSPSGSWQKAERGEIALDEAFFELFRRELENKRRWEEYWGKILKLADGEDGKDAVLPKGPVLEYDEDGATSRSEYFPGGDEIERGGTVYCGGVVEYNFLSGKH